VQVASIVKDMYTDIFSVIQPVIEGNVEKLLSIGRDFGGNKVKHSDQGVNCNLTEEIFNAKETFSTIPSSSIDSGKGCSRTQHSQSQTQAEISCSSQKKSSSELKLTEDMTNFINTLSTGENSDLTLTTKNSADCQKSTCATADVIKQDGQPICDKQTEKDQAKNTLPEKVNATEASEVANHHRTASVTSPAQNYLDKTRVVTTNEKSATKFGKQPEEGDHK